MANRVKIGTLEATGPTSGHFGTLGKSQTPPI